MISYKEVTKLIEWVKSCQMEHYVGKVIGFARMSRKSENCLNDVRLMSVGIQLLSVLEQETQRVSGKVLEIIRMQNEMLQGEMESER